MGLIEVVTDVSNCNAHQDINAPIYGAKNAHITFGNIDCSKELSHKGGDTDFTLGLKGGKGKKLNLMNLGFMQDFGNGLQTASQYGSQAYKIGKTVAPYAGEAMQYAAPETYEKYAVPATEDFMKAKDIGKSMGGWNEVGKIGRELDGNTVTPVAIILL